MVRLRMIAARALAGAKRVGRGVLAVLRHWRTVIETGGCAALIHGLAVVWQPLGWISLGVVLIVAAELWRP